MIWLYRILFFPAFLILFPYYLFRMLRRGGYQKGFSQRLGGGSLPQKRPAVRRVWLQAVSVGEIRAMEPLIRRFLKEAHLEIILTTTTSTGYALAHELFSREKDSILWIRYFPLDFWCFSKRTWDKITPDLALLAEGEIWPEHLHQANKRNIPLILLNARLSDRSFHRFQRVGFLVKRLLRKFSRILASSKLDADRFQALGTDPERILVTGNLKLEIPLSPLLSGEEKRAWCQRLGFLKHSISAPTSSSVDTPKILAGVSTWPGEERFLWELLENIRQTDPAWRLLLIPRHAERGAALRREFLTFSENSSSHMRNVRFWEDPIEEEYTVVVANVTGRMHELLQGVDIAFIGKTLPPHHGGQTPLEAASFSLPIVTGPHTENFRALVREMKSAQALRQADTREEAFRLLKKLMCDPHEREATGQQAGRWLDSQKGTLDRVWKELTCYL